MKNLLKKFLEYFRPKTKEQKSQVDINRELWLNALESGKYKQGIGNLKCGDKYCCLGVACEIFSCKQTVEDHTKRVFFDGSVAILPKDVVNLLGLYGRYGDSSDDSNALSLAGLNDGGFSFKEIVKIIRDNPRIYFKEQDAKQ